MVNKPNILFLFADDLRFDALGSLGSGEVQTPNIARLAASGTSFTHASIPGGTSPAICMPCRAMLHTGRTLFHLSGSGETIPTEHKMMGEVFQEQGYDCFGTGKWHNGRESFARSFNCGADIFFGGMTDHWNVPAYDFDPAGRYDSRHPLVDAPVVSNEVTWRDCDHISLGKHSSELHSDAVIQFLEQRTSQKPFFAYVSYLAPHDPRTMPERFLKMYDPEKIDLPSNFLGGHPFDNGALKIRDEVLADFPRDPVEVRRHIAEYFAMITHLDFEIGRVLTLLDEKGLRENTIIVFAGDNGLAVGQHGLMGKQNCYDHSQRVPLIFSGPGISVDQRRQAFAYLLDIFPTLCQLTETDIPDSVEGSSLLPVLNDSQAEFRPTTYHAYERYQRAVRNHRFKLIEYHVNGIRTSQLFDLERDPWETVNLGPDSAYSDTVTSLRTELVQFRDAWDDRESSWGQEFWDGWVDVGS